MRKMKKNKDSNRLVCRVFGMMLVLCMLLADMSAQLIFAGSRTPSREDLLPGSVTIDTPKALSEIALPKSDYGTLSWKNGSIVPSVYNGSYEVLFKAGADGDFSQISGWNAESRTISGKVTVYVKSLAPAKDEDGEEEEAAKEEAGDAEASTEEEPEEAPLPSEATEDDDEEEPEDAGAVEEPEETEEEAAEPDAPAEEPDTIPEEEESEAPSVSEEEPTETEEPAGQEAPVEELPNPTPASPMELIKEEARPTQVSEEMSLEEQAAVAAANHTCRGITVSADFLPWYVQFRVSDGSGYGFTNAEDAATFQAYEFQLWDLREDVEYQIPEGKSVQVTMPVPTGYTYSIQHILPDGTREAIEPAVYGGMLVFTTSSFSPFGIAGSRPLVGEQIANGSYGGGNQGNSVTPSAAPSATGAAARPVSGSSSTAGSSSRTSGGAQNAAQGSTGTTAPARFEAASSTGNSSTGVQNTTMVRPVKTGDYTVILPYVILALGALLVIVALILFLKRRSRKNRDKKRK